MSTLSKPVLTEPAAAAAAGCYATCTAYVENKTREVTLSGGDKGYRTFSNYLLQAFPANGWEVVAETVGISTILARQNGNGNA